MNNYDYLTEDAWNEEEEEELNALNEIFNL